jgi:serine/threonine-protein kinase
MAPEQAEEHANEITTGADVYSLGAILYELLTGRPPYSGVTAAEVLERGRTALPARPTTINAGIHRDLEAICLKCLERDPTRRYATTDDLADDLARFLAGEPTRGRPLGAAARALRLAARHPLAAALGALLLLAAGYTVITALLLVRAQHDAFRATDFAARRTADLTALQIESFARLVEEAGRDPLVVAAVGSARDQDLADVCEVLRARPAAASFNSWWLLDPSGVLLGHAPVAPAITRGRSYEFRDYYLGAKKLANERRRSVYVSTAYRSESDGAFQVGLSVPVYNATGRWIAVLTASLTTNSVLGAVPLDDPADDRLTVAIISPRGRERTDGDDEHDPIFLVHRRLGPGEALAASTDTGPDTGALMRLAPVRGTPFSVLVRFSYDGSLATRLGRMEILIAWMPIAAAGALIWGLFRWARRRAAPRERPSG